MVNAVQFAETESKDLKAKDFIGKRFKLVISKVEVVEYEATDKYPANQKLALHFEGKEKRLVLNARNTEKLVVGYGAETDDWTGKEVALSTIDYSDSGFPPGWDVQPTEVEFDDDLPFS